MENRTKDQRRALAWLADQLRWERTLEALRAGETVAAPQRGAPGRLTADDRSTTGPIDVDPRSRPPGGGRSCAEDAAQARTQRGATTSSTCWNTTRTGSPISIVVGSISLIAPSGDATRLPTKRIVGSSSSATTITL